MKETIYTKYSTERARKYRIKTAIYFEDGVRSVEKVAMTGEAKLHVDGLDRICRDLSEIYRDRYEVSACRCGDGVADFPYHEGITLAQQMDRKLAEGDAEGFVELLDSYKERTFPTEKLHGFTMSEDFSVRFGAESFPEGTKSLPVSDIDMTFDNIIVDDTGKWNLIDYEWTFSFDVPADYILYRAITQYVNFGDRGEKIRVEEILARCEIGPTEREAFGRMDAAFLAFVQQGAQVLPDLQKTSGRMETDIRKGAQQGIGMAQIFYDRGSGFSEEASERVNPPASETGECEFRIPVDPELRLVRIDPADHSCILEILSCETLDAAGRRRDLKYRTNGHHIKGNLYAFPTSDPQILPGAWKSDAEQIVLRYRIC